MKTPLAALVGVALVAPALAYTGPWGPHQRILEMDFATLDANRDGAVTLDEWRTAFQTLASDRFQERIEERIDALMAGDTDGDGKLSREELRARVLALAEAHRAGAPHRRGPNAEANRHRDNAAAPGRRGGEAGPPPAANAREAKGRSREERSTRLFQRIDRDRDGRLTSAEFEEARRVLQETAERRANRYTEGGRQGPGPQN